IQSLIIYLNLFYRHDLSILRQKPFEAYLKTSIAAFSKILYLLIFLKTGISNRTHHAISSIGLPHILQLPMNQQ
ncbi:hypothetical protein NXV09_20395, partial [Parabacteroides distasonis]|nr:hypothetical protein [Parabacteroides distasonis]